jgi:prepilin-type N-terminal cleavage/methylation domain-containing protein
MQILKLKQKGFTLIELLIVIGILAILLAITIVALNPRQNFQQANDTQRKSDVSAILNAVNQYAAANKGQLPAAITTSSQAISDGAADLCSVLVPTYLADLPEDPTTGTRTPAGLCTGATTYDTGYTIIKSAAGDRVTVGATGEITAVISVTR